MIRLQREKMFPGLNFNVTGINWLGVDIKESADEYTFNFEMPGAMKDDIKIWFEGNVLTISGEKREAGKDSEKNLLSERIYGKFERSFRMPSDVDGNNIKAESVNGVLIVTVPKSEKSKRVNVGIN